MLARLWTKGSSRTLWVEMQTGAAIVENNMEFLQKLKMKLPFDPTITVLGLYPKRPDTPKEPMYPNVHGNNFYNIQVLETA